MLNIFNISTRKKIFALLFAMFLFITSFFVFLNIDERFYKTSIKIVESKENTVALNPDVTIPDDYTTIQKGINHASPGDTIFVKSGIYKENIIVDKKEIFICGENKFTTIIDGGKITDAVTISAPCATLQGFTITNGWDENDWHWNVSGVKILSSNVVIEDNIITLNRMGINTAATAYNLTISNNSFIDDGLLFGNFEYSHMTKESFFHTITNNTINGKPLYYYKNHHNFSVPTDAGQIILADCTDVTIEHMYLTHTDFSIILAFCSHCIVENSTVTETDGEVVLIHSNNNMIQHNTISRSFHGICLDFESKYNVVRYNEVSYNLIGISVMTSSNNNLVHHNRIHNNQITTEGAGIWLLEQAYNNTVSENEIYNNKVGIRVTHGSVDNVIQNNNFKKNFPISAMFMVRSTNSWDNNYWNRPRILPKPIIGFKTVGKILIPWINIDWHPAKRPFEI